MPGVYAAFLVQPRGPRVRGGGQRREMYRLARRSTPLRCFDLDPMHGSASLSAALQSGANGAAEE